MPRDDRPSLPDAELYELALADVLRRLGLVLYPFTIQGTARHILYELRMNGYHLTESVPIGTPTRPPTPIYAIIDATGRDTGWTVIGKRQVPPPWLDETCPECGVKWRYPSPQCPHLILDRHPKG